MKRSSFSVMTFRLIVLLMVSAMSFASAKALAGAAPVIDRSERYTACLAEVGRDPSAAYEHANGWAAQGGGPAARHCAASALLALGRAHDAATALEALAVELGRVGSPLVPDVLGQAGRAWLTAGEPERANAVETAALKLTPDAVDLLIDRAVTLATANNFKAAAADLDHALSLAPRRVDALVFRGAARRALNDLARAAGDLDTALSINPNNVDALLERGNLRRQKGETKGARADWLAILKLAPDAPAADFARANIERLDVKQP